MKILFDYQIFQLQSYGGISRYFTKLAESFIKLKHEITIHCPVYKNNYLENELIKKSVNGLKIKGYPKYTNRFFHYINYNLTSRHLNKNQTDILHLTYYNKVYNFKKKTKKILTIFDLIHEKFNYFYDKDFLNYKKKSIDFADEIICISSNTKNDLLNFYDVDESKISVIHLGVEEKSYIKKVKFDQQVILYVGARRKYKNFDNFIKAYSISNNLVKNSKIICFGGGKFTEDEKKNIESLHIPENKISQISGDDNLLNQLYKSAEFLIAPSLYEGFGLPILEAMSCGCPVLCGDNSSMPEVANDAALYFDANEVESIRYSMQSFFEKTIIKKKLIQRGLENIKKFTWKSCAKNTLEIYKRGN